MCLSINLLHFNPSTKEYIAKTAEFDLEVSKGLSTTKCYKYVGGNRVDNEVYYTPFQNIQINFKDGKYLQKAGGNGAHLKKRSDWRVNQGIHSVYSTFSRDSTVKWFHAIIPKGVNFFIGDHDDVVSERLLLFETEKDYENYRKNNEIKTEWWHDYCSKKEKTV